MMVTTFASPSVVPLPPGFLADSSSSAGVPEDMNLFIIVQSLSLCLHDTGGEDKLLQEPSRSGPWVLSVSLEITFA
jgi:hypothetical protein